jgi:hypothetical protein
VSWLPTVSPCYPAAAERGAGALGLRAVTLGTLRAAGSWMITIDIDPGALAGVCGGMNLDGARRSENIEDRRNMSLQDSMAAPTQPSAPLPPLVRKPGDLSAQAGLDDIRPGR